MPESTSSNRRIRSPLRDVVSSGLSDAEQPVPATDQELMVGLAAGELDALEALYDRYSALVFSVGLRVLYDRQLAEDVVQEVFLRLWRRPWSYDAGRGRFVSWLMSVTRNRAIDERRRLTRRGRLEERSEDRIPELRAPSRYHDPLEEASLAEERRAVRHQMTRLPPAQRQVLELAYFAGLTQVEISERTGQPLGTVKTRIRLGMQKLREALSDLRKEELP